MPSLAISCSALRIAAFSSSVVANFLARAKASLSGSWSAIDFWTSSIAVAKALRRAIFVLQLPGQPAADFLDPRVGGDLRRFRRQLIDEVSRLIDVVVLDELLQRCKGTVHFAGLHVLENHDGNDGPHRDDERGKDGQRHAGSSVAAARSMAVKPLAVAFFQAFRHFAFPPGFTMQAVQLLGRLAGRDGLFQAGDRGCVPRGLLRPFRPVRATSPARRRLPGAATDRRIVPRLRTTSPTVALARRPPSTSNAACMAFRQLGRPPQFAQALLPGGIRPGGGNLLDQGFRPVDPPGGILEFGGQGVQGGRVAAGNRLRHFPLQFLDPLLLEDPDILVPDRVFRVGIGQAPQGFEAELDRSMAHRQEAVPLQERGQRLLDGVGLVEVGGHVEHERGRRRETVQRKQFVPGIAFGKIEDFDDIEEVRLDFAELDRFAPQPLAQEGPALPQALVGLVDRQRVVGRRALQEIVPILAVVEQGAADIIDDSLVVKHCMV